MAADNRKCNIYHTGRDGVIGFYIIHVRRNNARYGTGPGRKVPKGKRPIIVVHPCPGNNRHFLRDSTGYNQQRHIKIKMKKTIIIYFLLITVWALFAPLTVNAAVTMQEDLRPGYAVNLPVTGTGTVASANAGNVVLQMIAGSLIYAAGPLAVLMLAIGGFRYVISHGDQTQMEGAKKTITYAIIGLVVIIVSYAIVSNIINVIQRTPESATTTPATTTTGTPAPTPTGAQNAIPQQATDVEAQEPTGITPEGGTPTPASDILGY
jgi:hypothetical protein